MKTFSLRERDVQHSWYVVDAKDLVVGRLASVIAKVLRGKTDPRCTLHMNHGIHVVVVNAEKVHFTGGKDKPYYRHTGHPGGIKSCIPSDLLKGPHFHRVVEKAVERMLGKAGPLRRDRMKDLHVYKGPDHPHQGQKPVLLDVGSWNSKNRKRGASV